MHGLKYGNDDSFCRRRRNDNMSRFSYGEVAIFKSGGEVDFVMLSSCCSLERGGNPTKAVGGDGVALNPEGSQPGG